MSFRARVIAFILGFVLLGLVSFLVRRRRIYNVYAIMWFLVSIIFLTMATLPQSVEALSSMLGIFSTPIAILVVAIAGLIALVLHLSIIATEHHKFIRKFEKEIALLKKQEPTDR